ncbi:alpha/beta fold hydrolase [Nocardia sp. NPDC059091]|uniref:alpha/beta fold hydrolase n=1 Tax=Nocardia sp. NPDC059091 TaxID=3346724 RepID=UPI0036A05841
MSDQAAPTVVLVHGAFADASGFARVIRELSTSGHSVIAPPNPLRGLRNDAGVVHSVVAALDGPVVLVGHSYGGAVIGQAAAGLSNVTALVYLAAFSLDTGESCIDVQQPFAPSLLAETARPTPYDAPGAAGGPDLYIDGRRFRETFCADVPVDLAQVMGAAQRPLAAAALAEKAMQAGWKEIPSWYQVAGHDNAINPEVQRFMAKRMGSTIDEVDGSHTVFISRPVRVAEFIKSAIAWR